MNTSLRSAMILASATALALTALTLVYLLSRGAVQQSQQQWLRREIAVLLPPEPHDEDPLSNVRQIRAAALGGEQATTIHTVFRQGQPLGAVLGIVAPDGYNGDIAMLLGLHADGRVIGVRVTAHRETPGLGDRIELRRSDWIRQFEGWQLEARSQRDREDTVPQADYDGMSGATITARAVIQAVQRALRWFAAHRDQVFPG